MYVMCVCVCVCVCLCLNMFVYKDVYNHGGGVDAAVLEANVGCVMHTCMYTDAVYHCAYMYIYMSYISCV